MELTHRPVVWTIALAALVAPMAFSSGASAATDLGARDLAASSERRDVRQSPDEVRRYWTPERMAKATVLPEQPSAEAPSASTSTSLAREASVPPTPAKVDATQAPAARAGARSGTQLVAAVPELTLYKRPYASAAEKASGKVFYTTPAGRNSWCSAGSITAPNKSLVWTAAHCVGAGYANVAYVPAYNSANTGGRTDGDAPYGVWPARAYFAGVYPENDHTAVVVSQVDGDQLQDVVGAQGVRFNSDLSGEQVTVIGYPGARIYDGADMTHCTNTVQKFSLTGRVSLRCDTEGGSSGGPYITGNAGAGNLGYQVATHSQGGGMNAYGDPFDSVAQGLYDQAAKF